MEEQNLILGKGKGKGKDFLSAITSEPALRPTQPPVTSNSPGSEAMRD